MKTIVLTGGGTAGHCIPNVALLPYLKKNFNNIVYIGSKNGIEKSIISKHKIKYHQIIFIMSLLLSQILMKMKIIKSNC